MTNNWEADAITAALFRAQGEAGLAHLYLTDRRGFDRRMERGRQHFFGPPSGAHAAYLRSKWIIEYPSPSRTRRSGAFVALLSRHPARRPCQQNPRTGFFCPFTGYRRTRPCPLRQVSAA